MLRLRVLDKGEVFSPCTCKMIRYVTKHVCIGTPVCFAVTKRILRVFFCRRAYVRRRFVSCAGPTAGRVLLGVSGSCSASALCTPLVRNLCFLFFRPSQHPTAWLLVASTPCLRNRAAEPTAPPCFCSSLRARTSYVIFCLNTTPHFFFGCSLV